jgi:hypothetical protein
VRSDWYATKPMGMAGAVASPRLRVVSPAAGQFAATAPSLHSQTCNEGIKRPKGSGESTG